MIFLELILGTHNSNFYPDVGGVFAFDSSPFNSDWYTMI